MADSSPALALQHRFEAAYDRHYNRALTLLLKLREAPNPDSTASSDPPIQIATETWDDDFEIEPNSEAVFQENLVSNG